MRLASFIVLALACGSDPVGLDPEVACSVDGLFSGTYEGVVQDTLGATLGAITLTLSERETHEFDLTASYQGSAVVGVADVSLAVDEVDGEFVVGTYIYLETTLSNWPGLDGAILPVRNNRTKDPSACPSGFVVRGRALGEVVVIRVDRAG